MPPKDKKRKSYTVDFKVKVVLSAIESNNVSETAKKFGIHRKQVCQKVKLFVYHSMLTSLLRL